MTDARFNLLTGQRQWPSAESAARAIVDGGSLGQALAIKETDLSGLRALAHDLLSCGQIEPARRLLDMLVLLGDTHPLLPLLFAIVAEHEGDLDGARELLREQLAAMTPDARPALRRSIEERMLLIERRLAK